MYTVLPALEKEMFGVFRSRRKFAEGNYAIFLTNQFYKDQFMEEVKGRFRDVQPITTSGTIRKCKSVMARHQETMKQEAGEISTLLQD